MPDTANIYYPRELSWLSFNQRVLQEAADVNNPIIERIRFLGIYSNNMDEFYLAAKATAKAIIAGKLPSSINLTIQCMLAFPFAQMCGVIIPFNHLQLRIRIYQFIT